MARKCKPPHRPRPVGQGSEEALPSAENRYMWNLHEKLRSQGSLHPRGALSIPGPLQDHCEWQWCELSGALPETFGRPKQSILSKGAPSILGRLLNNPGWTSSK